MFLCKEETPKVFLCIERRKKMLWEKAKNLIIIFFLMLNAVLAALNYTQSSRHVLTAERRTAVISMLNQNKISIYIEILRDYKPRRILSVYGYEYDMEKKLAMLFPENADITRLEYDGREEYVCGDIVMTFSNGYIAYDNPSGLYPGVTLTAEAGVLSRSAAIAACEAFMSEHFPDFVYDVSILPSDSGWRIFYRQVYQRNIIHTNFVEIVITPNGIEQLDIQYGKPAGFVGSPREICAPDEALLTFMQRIKDISGDSPVIINHMDLAYIQDEPGLQKGAVYMTTPYYRVFVEHLDQPYLINAFTNRMR